jgi:cephalosporin hydroxylase
VTDDRAQFEEDRRRWLAELRADDELRRTNLELTTQSDRHNFSYVWKWLGVPIIQTPTDVVAVQEVIWECRPEFIVETGVARGGSVVLYASLLELLGGGEVIGIDVDIRPHNRDTIEQHPMARRIRLIEGSSTDPEVIEQVRVATGGSDRVMVVLDSDHTHQHVLGELRAYAPMVGVGQYLVVADTIVEHLPVQTHRPRHWGPGDNPATAVAQFLSDRDDFEIDAEIDGKLLLASSPSGFLRRIRPEGERA